MDVGNFLLGFVIVLGVVLTSMILHELTHGLVAYALGDDTAKANGRLTLNPFKHLDPFLSIILPLLLYVLGGPIFGGAKPVPVDSRRLKGGPWGMALVAIAGPLTNILLALVAFLIGNWTGVLSAAAGTVYASTGLAGTIFSQFIMINLGFGIFNILPIPPLDGSRVLYAIAPDGARRVLEVIERYGLIIVLVLVWFGSSLLSQLMYNGIDGILHAFCFLVGAG